MNYCDNCSFVCEQTSCPICGHKRLREVRDDDFCFLADSKTSSCEMLTDILEEHDIPYVTVPYGKGSVWALPMSGYKLYVPYRFFEKARSELVELENAETERLKTFLLENQNGFNVSLRNEKKFAKKLKLLGEQDLFSYCLNIIKSSKKIVDEGDISNCPKRGHYLFCYSDNATIAFNSKTFEILSITVE